MPAIDITAKPNVAIRRATPQDWPSLLAFYETHHPHRTRLTNSKIFTWLFIDQPGARQRFPFFVLEIDGQIAGAIGYVLGTLGVDDQLSKFVTPINYFVGLRGKGLPALLLFRAVMAESDTVICSYVSKDAKRLTAKLGFVDRGEDLLCSYYSLKQSGSLRSVVFGGARRLMEWSRRLLGSSIFPAMRFKVSAELISDCEPLFVASRGMANTVKTYEFLRWRYVDSPLLKCSFIYQYLGVEIAGVAVVHHDQLRRELILLEMRWKNGRRMQGVALLDAVIGVARQLGCDTVVSHTLSEQLRPVFKLCLFFPVISQLGITLFSRDRHLHGVLSRSTNLSYMLGDTDAY